MVNFKKKKDKKNMLLTQLKIGLDVEGLHNWETIKHDSDPQLYKEVSYLQFPHRHTFKINLTIEVSHRNREEEFIHVKHKLKSSLSHFWNVTYQLYNFGSMSCEMIGDYIFHKLKDTYKISQIEVSEDGEFSSILTYIP